MIKRGFLLLLCTALPASADDAAPSRVIDLGANKVVTFAEDVSPDGTYAIGWTVLVKNQRAKPVDWSKLTADDVLDFLLPYLDPSQPPARDDDYQLVDCVIDLKGRHLLVLPSSDPYFPHKNHADLATTWSPAGPGNRYAVINNDGRFETTNMWLVVMDGGGMQEVDLVRSLGQAIDPLLRQKRPMTHGAYGTSYFVADADKTSAFTSSSLKISFTSDLPKSQVENSEVDGTVQILLPDGKISGVASATPADDALIESPALGKADAELNKVYAQLQQKLSPAGRQALKKEQLDWIDQRDSDAAQAQETLTGGAAATIQAARNQALLDDTNARVAVLQRRLP